MFCTRKKNRIQTEFEIVSLTENASKRFIGIQGYIFPHQKKS